MTIESHQELIRLIENIATRENKTENQTDKELFKEALLYLDDLQIRQSKELE